MKARRLMIVVIVLIALVFFWRKFFTAAPVAVAPVAEKKVIRDKTPDASAWVAPGEVSVASAVAAGLIPRAIDEPMPHVVEGVAAPVLLAQGQFRPALEEHDVSGWVKLYRLADQSYLVRIETLWMEGTPPELDVVLVHSPKPRTDADVQAFLMAGPLKETSGTMNYPMSKDGMSEAHALALVLRGSKQLYASAPIAPK